MGIRYRKLSTDNDYTFGNGLANFYINEIDAVKQSVITRLKLWEGEWFLDIIEGTAYKGEALGKYTKDTIDPMIKDRILNTDGVIEILEYSSVYDGDLRNYTVNVTISTDYGTTTIEGVL